MKKIIALAVFLLSMSLQSYGQTFWRQTQADLSGSSYPPSADFKSGVGGVVCYNTATFHDKLHRTYFVNRFGDTTKTIKYIIDTTIIYTRDNYAYTSYGVLAVDTARYLGVPMCVARLNNGNYIFGCYPSDSTDIEKIKSVVLTDSLGNVLRTRFFDDTLIYNTGGTEYSRINRIANSDSVLFYYTERENFIDTAVAYGSEWTNERYYFNLFKLGPDLDTLWHVMYKCKIDDSIGSGISYHDIYERGFVGDIIFTRDGGALVSYYHDTDNNLLLTSGSGYIAKNYLVKFNSNGNIEWQKTPTELVGTSDTSMYRIYLAFELGDSTIICGVNHFTTSGPSSIAFLLSIDPNGNLIDSISYPNSAFISLSYPIGRNKIVANAMDLNNLALYDKHFNYLDIISNPVPEYLSNGLQISDNSLGGVFMSYYKPIDTLTSILNFVNLDSNFNIYPSKLTGKVVFDRNNDCIYNAGDLIRPASLVAQEVGTDRYYYRFTNDSGNYSFPLPYGNYTITHPVSANKLNECGVYSINITEPIVYSGNDFYDTVVPGIKNFRIQLYNGRMRPWDTCYINSFLHNLGSVDVDTVVNIILDNRVAFVDASVTPTAISGDTLKYNLHLVPDSFCYIGLRVIPNTSLIVGDTLHFMAYSPFNNNVDPTSDSVFLDAPAFTAYDPNIKMANQPLYFPKNNDLVYTVCFQNTGNDTARHIIVEDSISNLLDIPTFMLLSSTHDTPEVKWTVGNKVQFIFKNIYLPDSNVNEPASHGSFSYKISPKATANEGDTILNTAYIYFDYNPAIITNTTVNILEKSRVSSVNHLTEQDKIIVYPNPTNGNAYIKLPNSITDVAITITDMSGRVVQQIERSQPTVEISLKESPGIYLVKIVNKNSNAIYYKRITKY